MWALAMCPKSLERNPEITDISLPLFHCVWWGSDGAISALQLSHEAWTNMAPEGQVGLGRESTQTKIQFVPWFSSVQLLSCVWLFVTPWTTACQASLSITNSWSLPKLMSIESVMPSNHLILCHPLLLLTSILPSIRVFSNESALCMRWPKYWSFSFNISPSNEHSGLTSFKMDCWISSQSKGLSRVSSNTTVQKQQFFGSQLSLLSNSHIHTWLLEKP